MNTEITESPHVEVTTEETEIGVTAVREALKDVGISATVTPRLPRVVTFSDNSLSEFLLSSASLLLQSFVIQVMGDASKEVRRAARKKFRGFIEGVFASFEKAEVADEGRVRNRTIALAAGPDEEAKVKLEKGLPLKAYAPLFALDWEHLPKGTASYDGRNGKWGVLPSEDVWRRQPRQEFEAALGTATMSYTYYPDDDKRARRVVIAVTKWSPSLATRFIRDHKGGLNQLAEIRRSTGQ